MQVRNFTPSYKPGSMKGTFTAVFPSGMIIHYMKYFEKDGKRWIGYPSKMVDEASKKWVEYIEFPEEDKRTIRDQLVAILKQQQPEQPKDDDLPNLPSRSWSDDEVPF